MKKTESEQNRNDAYAELQPKLGLRQRVVYELIDHYGPITISEIANKMALGTNHISGRTKELEMKCLIRDKGSKKNLNTKVKNTLWEIIPIEERSSVRQAKINILAERATHLSIDFDSVASWITKELIKKEIFRTDQKLALLI